MGVMVAKKLISVFFLFSFLIMVATVNAATIDVSQPIQLTNNEHYERGQSIIYDGSNYWLFYGRSATVTGNYGNPNPTDPDTHDYELYYKKASTISNLATATPTRIDVPHNANIYQGETDSAYFNGYVRVYASVDVGADATLYQWSSNDGGVTWSESIIELGLADGAAHFAAINCDNKLWFAYQLGNNWKSKYYTTSWSSEYDITNNYGTAKFYCEGSNLYFIRADSGDQDIYQWGGAVWNQIDSATESGPYDPTIYKIGTKYVAAYAPWVSPKQWIKAKTGTSLNTLLSSGTEVDITSASYGSNVWIDMWPTGFTDALGSPYLFYTSERNPNDPNTEITGNIWYLPVEWPVTNDHYTYIQNAIEQAINDDTINVAAGTYNEGISIIDKDLTILGDSSNKPLITPTENTGLNNEIGVNGRGWFQVTGANVIFQNLIFDGTGKNVRTAIHYHVDSTGGKVENCDFRNIKHTSQYHGRAINNYGQYVEILGCTFENIQRIGVFTFNPDARTLIKDCTYTGKGIGDFLDYGFEVGNEGDIKVEGCTITNCKGVASVDGSTSAGILVTTAWGSNTKATIIGDTISDSTTGIAVGYSTTDTSVVVAKYNNVIGNDVYGISSTGPLVNAENNWWGSDTGPSGEGSGTGNAVSTNVDYEPWLGAAVVQGSFGPERMLIEVGTPETSGDGSITVEAFGAGTGYLDLITYQNRPWTDSAVFSGASNFFDVKYEPGPYVDPGITSLDITFQNPGGSKMYWWNKGTESWGLCSNQVLNGDGSITITVTATTTPTLDDLADPPFGGGDPLEVPVMSPIILVSLFLGIAGFGYFFVGKK